MGRKRRLVLDITLATHWRGPPVGMLRREQALAKNALATRPDISFCVFDRSLSAYRAIRSDCVETAIRCDTTLGGMNRARNVFEEPSPFGPDDTILTVGNHAAANGEAVAALKRRQGFRFVSMCHDIIPLTFPEMFEPGLCRDFRRYWHAVLPLAEIVLVNSLAVQRDIHAYCQAQGMAHGRLVHVHPGCDLSGVAPAPFLPAPLEPGRFILFVGTVEPRKGHAMILDIWQRLVEKGLPQSRRFSLVVVGRPGWLVEGVLRRLGDPAAFAGTLIYLSGADDAVLARLYRDCAFGLLPSRYEGFGMPLIECFAGGRAMIVSAAGALPEVAGPFALCLPPGDAAAWQAMLERWIEDDGARAPYEAAIRDSFRPVTWDAAAAEIFDRALEIRP